jgi:predicted acetyltransferase
MNDRSLEYGPARAEELAGLNRLLEQALTFPVGNMAQWTEALGHDHLRVVRRDGRVVAGMGIIPMGHYFGGRSVPAGGITAVGVAPDQRGSGVGVWMIRRSLRQLRERGTPIATLYPATTAFYRRAGFERAAQRIIYEIPILALGERDYALEAAPAGPDDHATIKQLYAQQAVRTAAFLDRPEFYWNNILAPEDKPAYAFVVRHDSVPEGYVVFGHASWGEALQVRDLVALTPAAGRRLLTLLADHRSMIETVRLPAGPNDTNLFLLPEQKHKVSWMLDLMLRVVDVAGALSARGYSPAVGAQLHLAVEDDLLPENNGRFVLEVADGQGRVQAGGEGRLRLHVRALAALYTGHLLAPELAALGMLDGSPADLALAAAVFAGPRPWTPDMF